MIQRVMVFRKSIPSLILLSVAITACGRDPDLLYYRNPPPREVAFQEAAVREMENGGRVDIVFVVDNSGSMGTHQTRLAQSTSQFMDEFLKKGSKFDWRIGLISSDMTEKPYLGFTKADRCDRKSVDPKRQFQNAVSMLGTDGDATEQFLGPLSQHLSGNDFLRKHAYLAVFFMTDTHEQSPNSVKSYFDAIVRQVGDEKRILFYGAYASDDTPGCTNEGWSWNSLDVDERRWKDLFTLRPGSTRYDLCLPDLGKQMSAFAKDVIDKVDSPKILLKDRPFPNTLVVTYEGTVIPGGRYNDPNAVWFYDYTLNAVVFKSLDLFPADTSKVQITYDVDDGRPEV